MNTESNRLTETGIGAAIEGQRDLEPGSLESAYQRALEHELTLQGVGFEAQKTCPVACKGLIIEDASRPDLLVGEKQVAELKAVDALADGHEAQVLAYLKFTGCHIGLLINFCAGLLRDGLRRLAL
ncbi:MAG: GxxExxY protein [Verrucomicrobiota bacterium]